MTSQQLIEILEDIGAYGEVRRYNGRGMYGKECVGWVVETDMMLHYVADIVANIEDETERQEFADMFRSVKTYNLGRDNTILYWPRMAWPKDGEE